jgi:hypothetical protein
MRFVAFLAFSKHMVVWLHSALLLQVNLGCGPSVTKQPSLVVLKKIGTTDVSVTPTKTTIFGAATMVKDKLIMYLCKSFSFFFAFCKKR